MTACNPFTPMASTGCSHSIGWPSSWVKVTYRPSSPTAPGFAPLSPTLSSCRSARVSIRLSRRRHDSVRHCMTRGLPIDCRDGSSMLGRLRSPDCSVRCAGYSFWIAFSASSIPASRRSWLYRSSHHLRCDPHGATVVDPLLGVQHGHDQQRNRRAQAVLEVRVAHACVEEHLTPFFDPRAVIEIAGIKLLEQELVPGVTTLVNRTRRRSLSLPLGLRLSLPA